MFDNVNISKAFELEDTIRGTVIEVATFNAVLAKGSNVGVYMNINYPELYQKNKDQILVEYQNFCGEVVALASTMGLASAIQGAALSELETIKQELTIMATQVFKDVIQSLGDIRVNPVPQIAHY